MANVCVRQLLAVLLVMAIHGILIVFPEMAHLEEAGTISRIILSVLLLIGMGIMVISCAFGDYGTEDAPQQPGGAPRPRRTNFGDEVAIFLENHFHLMGIYIFGVANIIFKIYFIISSASCIEYYFQFLTSLLSDKPELPDELRREEVVHLLLAILHLIYSLFKIGFLHKLTGFKSVHTKRTAFQHQVLLGLIGIDFATWMYYFMREIGTIDFYTPAPLLYGDGGNHTEAMACITHETVIFVYVKSTLSHFFFPMILEFMLTSVEVILHVLLLEHVPRNQLNVEAADAPLLDVYHDISDNSNVFQGSIFSLHDKKWYHKIWKCFISQLTALAALVLGILDAVLTNYYLLNKPEDDVRSGDIYYYSERYMISYVKAPVIISRVLFVYIPALIVASHCLFVLRKFKKARRNVPSIQGGDVILILAAVGHIILRVYQVFLSLTITIKGEEKWPEDVPVWQRPEVRWLSAGCALEALISILQNIVSILIIYYGERREVALHDSLHPYHSTLQGALSFLMAFSFIRWIIDSFYEMEFLRENNAYNQFGGTWEILVVGLLPFLIYFRYVCVNKFVRIKKLLRENVFAV